jgi:peptidoglycan/xylan/chitin deacetylase (PgdA/CDA1 family)
VKIAILTYHRVFKSGRPDCPPHEAVYALPAAEFEEQMRAISEKGLTVLGLGDLARVCSEPEGSENGSGRSVMITFDDGTEDHYQEVFPVLRKYGFKGVFFVVTGWIGRPGYLTWAQMEEMIGAGMDVQSHSDTHRFLSELNDAEAESELRRSKEILEAKLRTPVTAIGIPGGYYNRKTVEISKRVGYHHIFTSRWGFNRTAPSLDVLKRVSIRAGDGREFFRAALALKEFYFLNRRIKNLMLAFPKRLLGPSRYAALRRRFFSFTDRNRG